MRRLKKSHRPTRVYRHAIQAALGMVLCSGISVSEAKAHAEFQIFSQQSSGRPVNCAMCHAHSDGPLGASPGQIGSLSASELERLNRARSAFDPGIDIDSPVLNEFGNAIVTRLGKKRFLELRTRPDAFAVELGEEFDLDDDGISDAQEYLDGTHPLSAQDGAPLRLFLHNFKENGFHLVMIGVATLTTLFGLINILKGFALKAESSKR